MASVERKWTLQAYLGEDTYDEEMDNLRRRDRNRVLNRKPKRRWIRKLLAWLLVGVGHFLSFGTVFIGQRLLKRYKEED